MGVSLETVGESAMSGKFNDDKNYDKGETLLEEDVAGWCKIHTVTYLDHAWYGLDTNAFILNCFKINYIEPSFLSVKTV
jgi:hypothetical protein